MGGYETGYSAAYDCDLHRSGSLQKALRRLP